MTAAPAKMYGLGMQSIVSKEIDWVNDPIYAMIAGSAYVPNADTHRWLSDITSEATGTGYTAGGMLVATRSLNYDAPSGTLQLKCANPLWTGLTLTGQFVIFYSSTGVSTTSPLICYIDYGATFSPVAQDVEVTIPLAGLVNLARV